MRRLGGLDRELIDLACRVTSLLVDADDCIFVRAGDQAEGLSSLGVQPCVVVTHSFFVLDCQIATMSLVELLLVDSHESVVNVHVRWHQAELAHTVATSKTLLIDRFNLLLGRPPIRYLTEWRLNLASGLLRTTQSGITEIATRVGYTSEEALRRAFKRSLGKSPAHWRDSNE